MFDSDSDGGIERVESVSSMPEMFDVVPEKKDFQFKLFGYQCSKGGTNLVFPLKKGKELPYHTKTVTKKGRVFEIKFSKSLTPSVTGFSGHKEEDWWVFREDTAEAIEEETEASGDKLDVENLPTSETALPPGSLSLRSLPSASLSLRSPSPPRTDTLESESPTTPVCRPKDVSSPTVHQNPDWLKNLKKKENFKAEIIEPCSFRTKEAVRMDDYIPDEKEFSRVKNEIVNSVLAKLKGVYSTAGKPGKVVMKEMVVLLSYEYPMMFREREAQQGVRGIPGLERQASLMCDRYREQINRDRRAASKGRFDGIGPENEASGSAPKKGKLKDIYGVVSDKWHSKKKVSQQGRVRLIQASKELEFMKREAIFESLREELCYEFRNNSTESPDDICPGFMADPRHLSGHFEYITESPALNKAIGENFRSFMEHLEIYLKDVDTSIGSRKRLQEIETVCELDMQGSTLLRDLHILRWASEHFDNGGSSQLIRMSSNPWILGGELPSGDSSPHILAVLVDKTFVFELFAEGKRMMGNMDIITALAAFFHMAFVFNYKYPKEGQTLSDLIQRRVCKYGDESGTKTWKRKDPALTKVNFFCERVFKLMN